MANGNEPAAGGGEYRDEGQGGLVRLALATVASGVLAGIVAAAFRIVLVVEMTATTNYMLPMFFACLAATIVPTLLASAPIYDTLRQRMLGPSAAGP